MNYGFLLKHRLLHSYAFNPFLPFKLFYALPRYSTSSRGMVFTPFHVSRRDSLISLSAQQSLYFDIFHFSTSFSFYSSIGSGDSNKKDDRGKDDSKKGTESSSPSSSNSQSSTPSSSNSIKEFFSKKLFSKTQGSSADKKNANTASPADKNSDKSIENTTEDTSAKLNNSPAPAPKREKSMKELLKDKAEQEHRDILKGINTDVDVEDILRKIDEKIQKIEDDSVTAVSEKEDTSALEEKKDGLESNEDDSGDNDHGTPDDHSTSLPMVIDSFGSGPGRSGRESTTAPARKQPPHQSNVICVPVSRRPLIPGFYKTISVKNPRVAAALIQAVKKGEPYIGVFLTRDDDAASKDTIESLSEIYPVGTFASIISLLPPLGNDSNISNGSSEADSESNTGPGGLTAIVYPHRRILATDILTTGRSNSSCTRIHSEPLPDEPYDARDRIVRVLTHELFVVLNDLAKMNQFVREHILHHNVSAAVFDDPAALADFVAVLVSGESYELQAVLDSRHIIDRLKAALVLLKKEYVSAQLQRTISRDVEQKINQRQREYFLHEQLKVIKKELKLETDSKDKILDGFRTRAAELVMPEAVQKVFEEEMAKLNMLEPAGTEFNMTRNYLDWLVQVPWGKTTQESYDVNAAKIVLDADHYGLEDVKDRILEFIAVAKLKGGSAQGKILCLVGPPGVGKTSIGKSIARALNRAYYRFSVGGLGDVAEIKGHRRTYVGAMPGKVVQALKLSKTENPLVLIDEIDKIGRGSGFSHGGDPSSALLELLDPEQNKAFMDHYLDVPIDLSRVLFICTANITDTIPGPLLDRMEVIQLSGYIAAEKKAIAEQHLVPNAIIESGLKPGVVQLDSSIIDSLIKGYCREAGVRNLKKHIDKLLRKSAFYLVKNGKLGAAKPPIEAKPAQTIDNENISPVFSETKSTPAMESSITPHAIKGFSKDDNTFSDTDNSAKQIDIPMESLPLLIINEQKMYEYLGNPTFTGERLFASNTPAGVVMGLAWTSLGGTILYIETLLENSFSSNIPTVDKDLVSQQSISHGGGGRLIRTGQLGKVMDESSTIAYSVAKAYLRHLVVEPSLLSSSLINHAKFEDGNSKSLANILSFFDSTTVHLHCPEGATPKDGPSAGIAMATALLSLATNIPVRPDTAMTGELTLTGKVLRIGGLKEKTIAAKQAGVVHILFPSGNEADWKALPEHIRANLTPHPVDTFDQVVSFCLFNNPANNNNESKPSPP